MDMQLLQRAESGDVQAMTELARFYAMDENEMDMVKSTEWADRAAEAGSVFGCFLSMLGHSNGAFAAEGLGFWNKAIEEWNCCGNRAKTLLIAHNEKVISLDEEQRQTCLSNLEDATYGIALNEYSQDSENLEVSRKVLERLGSMDTTRGKALRARCYSDFQDYQSALPLMCDVINDNEYVASNKSIMEQAVFGSTMFDFAACYRYGIQGVVQQNINKAYEILTSALTGIEDDDMKAPIQNELKHYQKKMFGGFKYV